MLASVWDLCRLPGIVADVTLVFEEHHTCRGSHQLSSDQFSNSEGIYIQDENKFSFNRVMVGRSAEARFKLTNNSKVPCTLSLALRGRKVRQQHRPSKCGPPQPPRPHSCKRLGPPQVSGSADVFQLSATSLCIPSLSHLFAAITFRPQAKQHYSAMFETTLKSTSRYVRSPRGKVTCYSNSYNLIPKDTIICKISTYVTGDKCLIQFILFYSYSPTSPNI